MSYMSSRNAIASNVMNDTPGPNADTPNCLVHKILALCCPTKYISSLMNTGEDKIRNKMGKYKNIKRKYFSPESLNVCENYLVQSISYVVPSTVIFFSERKELRNFIAVKNAVIFNKKTSCRILRQI